MFDFPPIPSWHAAHPFIVHLPIGMLFAAPALLILAILFRRLRAGLATAAFIVLLMGAIGAFVAVSSGEAAEHLMRNPPPEVHDLVHEHEEGAERVRIFAAILAGAFALFLIIAGIAGKHMRAPVWIGALLIILIANLALNVFLLNTAHLGGRLVHTWGVMAPIDESSSSDADSHDDHDH
ncbi:MAG: hypothetical protein CMJ49_09555 [Planctomycetaceae bacterium]|nr:hypothetical protein [Planctomycetaceae bacterium]